MGLYILYAILCAIGALLIFMVIRTLATRPKPEKNEIIDNLPDEKELTDLLSAAVRIPTVTKVCQSDDSTPFLRYHEFLKTAFPEIFSRAEVTHINELSLIIKISGSDPDLMPGCFLAHQDVVPASPDGWEVDPFGGIVKDGFVYGRGSQDMKSQMITALYGLEILLREGREPVRTIYYCFGHDEELTGKYGARCIVEHLKKEGIRFAFVIDEGGTTLDGSILGMPNRMIALIGTCEKGYTDFRLTAIRDGGHASSPKRKSSVDLIADAIHDLKRSPMKATLSKPTKEMFKTLAPYMNFPFKFVMVNLDILSPIVKLVLSFIPITNSLIRTTFAFTQIQGSDAPNVIPVKSTAIVNTRINIGETREQVQNHIQKVVGKNIKVEMTDGISTNPTPISLTEGSEVYSTLVQSIKEAFNGYVVAPYPFIAASDAKYYYAISDNVYRFTPFEYSTDAQKRIHSLNERCKTSDLPKAALFFKRFLENTCYKAE